MNRKLIASMLLAACTIVGCDKKDDTSKQVDKAADKTASQASDAMGKVKDNVAEGADKAKDDAKANADKMKDNATASANSAMANVDVVQKQIDELISKAKSAINDKKWDDADGYLKQIKDLEAKLPQAAQDKINASLGDVQKMIDAGKTLVPSKDAVPSMPSMGK